MKVFKVLSAAEQVANHLREELLQGTWVDLMPGEDRLMKQLGIGHNTIREALNLLSEEGILESRGTGRQRKIVLPKQIPTQSLRIGIMLHDRADDSLPVVNQLRQRLLESGHIPAFSQKTMESLKMDADAVATFAQKTPCDAWFVIAGTRPILQWFSEQPTPAFAVYGHMKEVRIAGTTIRKAGKILDLIQELVDIGHRRIVIFARKQNIIPKIGGLEELFVQKLESCGIPTSEYNLPIWNEDATSLEECLDKLFKHTPPTAIYTDEPHHFTAIQNHLTRRGIIAPRDVSLICGQRSNIFKLQKPIPTHFEWDHTRMVGKAVSWASAISKGKKPPIKHWLTNAKLVRGGTTGPPPKRG